MLQEHHYQLKGGKNRRIADNVERVTTVFDHHNRNFEESDCVYNTATKKILAEKFEKVFLNHEQESEKCLQEFTEGNIFIWKPLKKTKLPTFNANVKSMKTKIDGKTIRFKEESYVMKNVMSRLIVAARSRLAWASILATMSFR